MKKKDVTLDFTGERMIPEHNDGDLVFFEHMSRYIFASQFVKDKTVLDIASGVGYGVDFFIKEGAKKVIGVDLDPQTIEYAKANYTYNNVDFKVGDAEDIPLPDNSVDVIVSFETIEHVNDYKKFLKETKRVLKKDGFMVISTPNTDVFSGNPFHTKEFALQEYRQVLKNHYKNLNMYYQNNLLSTLVSKDSTLKKKDLGQTLRADVFKGAASTPEESLYMVAVVGDSALPDYKENVLIDNDKELKRLYQTVGDLSNEKDLLKSQLKKKDKKEKQNEKKLLQIKTDLKNKAKELEQKEREVNEKIAEVARVYSSNSWKLTKPIRKIKNAKNKAGFLANKSKHVIKHEGFGGFAKKSSKFIATRVKSRVLPKTPMSNDYAEIKNWYEANKRKVTIVIPSYNDSKLLKRCLESINKTTNSDWVDIVISDDASPDKNHIKFLKSLDQKNIKVIFKDKNGGFSKNSNDGLKAANKNSDVILLNSDTEAKDYWLESLQYAAYSDRTIGIVGPKLLYPNGTIQYAGSHRNNGAPEWFDHYYRFKPSSYGPANIPNYIIGVTGACMYIKREVIDEIGLLDEGFPMAFEDMDYSIRAWNAGYKCYYFPKATLVHHESPTRGTTQGAREKESLRYFWEKWGDWFDRRNIRDKDGKIRVIYVLQSTGVSGGHRIVFEHLNRLKDMGYSVELYNLEGKPTWMPLNVPVKTFKNYPQLIAALEKEEAIKVATWWETAEPVWLASITKGIPVFFVQDIESSYYKDDPYMQQVVVSKYRREFRYLTTSGWNQGQLREMGIEPTVVPCGYDSDNFREVKAKREDNVLLAVGRSHYLKNLPMTLSAWGKVKKNQPTLWLFGIEPQLLDGVKNSKYFFKPSDSGVNELLNQTTVFVQTSTHEGFCLPILEAMAAGAPVICTNAHGNDDFCVHEQNCLMVGQNDVDGLKSAIERLFADKKLQKKFQKEGLKTAKQYIWPTVMKKLENFFLDVSGK